MRYCNYRTFYSDGNVLDPKPTCGVHSSGPIFRGQNVTLTCRVTYYYNWAQAPGNFRILRSFFDWQSEAGTLLKKSSTSLANNTGKTLQVDVRALASGTIIPSYTCASVFYFFRKFRVFSGPLLWWTCTSEPIYTWCMYCLLYTSDAADE